MCVCDDGFVRENGLCIPASECGCKLENGAIVQNGFIKDSCDEKCVCVGGEYKCEKQTDCLPDCPCYDGKNIIFQYL